MDHLFWREFRKRVKAANHDAFITGEIQHESSSWLRGEQMDSIMNYPLKEAAVDFFAKRRISAREMDNELAAARSLYMGSINRSLFNLLDSHDTVRFLTECGEDTRRLKLAAAFLFTYIGIPCIYYGDEVGLSGGYDPLCRKCMIWDKDKQDAELLAFYKALSRIRHNNKTLVYGDYSSVYNNDYTLAYKRIWEDEQILVMLNNSNDIYSIKSENIAGNYEDLLTGANISIEDEIELGPDEVRIFKMV